MSGLVSLLPPVAAYQLVAKNETAFVQNTNKQDPATQNAIAYFQSQAPNLTSPTALLKDYRSLQVVLSAYGMSGQISETGLLKDLMTQNPAASTSVVQQLANTNYLNFAKVFSNWNPPPLANPATVQNIVSQYQTSQFEQNVGQQDPNLQNALYFTRKVGPTTTLAQIMADPQLLSVAEIASGQPIQFGLLNYNQQVSILTKSVDLSQFATPAGVQKFAQQYLLMYQENPPPATPTDTMASLFGGSSSNNNGILALFGGGTQNVQQNNSGSPALSLLA